VGVGLFLILLILLLLLFVRRRRENRKLQPVVKEQESNLFPITAGAVVESEAKAEPVPLVPVVPQVCCD
jgi:hypothetical protein